MIDELKARKEAARGAQAQSLLDSDLLKEAFEGLEAEYIRFWREGTSINDTQGRERLWQAVQIVGKVRSHLTQIAADGRVAETELRALAQGA